MVWANLLKRKNYKLRKIRKVQTDWKVQDYLRPCLFGFRFHIPSYRRFPNCIATAIGCLPMIPRALLESLYVLLPAHDSMPAYMAQCSPTTSRTRSVLYQSDLHPRLSSGPAGLSGSFLYQACPLRLVPDACGFRLVDMCFDAAILLP